MKIYNINLNGLFLFKVMLGAYQNNSSAIKIINKIAPHWNTIVVKSSMNTKSDVLRNIKNDINVNVDTAMDVFLGDYNLIDNINVGSECSQIQRNQAKKSLVLYPERFNKLNKQQQDNLLTFLAKYRSTFNKLCVDSSMTIFKNIEQSQRFYNYDRLNREIINAFKDNNIAESVNGSFVSLFNSYNHTIKNNKDMLMTDKISWCCSYYLPLVDKLSEQINDNVNNETLYRQFYNKNNVMRIFPMMKNKKQINNMIVRGGNNEKIKPIIKTEYVYIGGDDYERQQPRQQQQNTKTTTSEYIESLINEQIQFNKSFEQIYKDLTKSLYSITLTDKQTTQSTSLNGCLYALKSIEINSPKTSYKISGYYSAKNWNKYYIAACYKVVDVLNKSGMSLFDETIKCVKDLINLCESSARKASEIINKYISSVKVSSEIYTNVKNVTKIPCKLSYQELNRYGENIKRLEQLFVSISNQTSVYSTAQSLDTFLSHVQDRNDLIREYFRSKETQLKMNGSAGFNNDRVEMLLQFNNQIKQCMLYLNQTVDTKLAEYRKQKNINSIDDKLFAKFEKAMIMFKDLSNNANLRNVLEKLNIVLTGNDFEGKQQEDKQKKYSLDLIRIIQRFWKESGYVDFLIQLYTELNIFPDGFNWSEFRDNITLLLSLINITVSTKYKINIGIIDRYNDEALQQANDISHEYVYIKDSSSIQNEVNHIIQLLVNDYNGIFNTPDIVNLLQINIFNGLQQMFNYASSSDKLEGKIQPIAINRPGVNKLVEITLTLYDKQFAMALINKSDNDSGETRLTKMIFDAMLVNVLDVINNYTSVKYTGNFKLPIQLSNIIKGGDKNMLTVEDDSGKTYGGNVFDILSVNDNNYDGVIVDATPFYVSAFNILLFYYQKYNIKRINDNEVSTPSLFFYVPKISPLYPIYKKIEAYNIDSTTKLNTNLIKTGIGVFNNYWRRAEGATPAEKLSSAIDILLNEVNACMVYSSKLQFDALQITGKLSNNFLQNLSSNIQNLSNSLINAIGEAVVDMSMSPLQQTELFETIMKNDLNKVRQKANSDEEKLAMLIDILTKSDDKKDASNEIYKFVDFAIMPMLETLMAYNNVFKTYDLYIVDNVGVNDQYVDLNKIKFIRQSINPDKNGKEITYVDWLRDVEYSADKDIELTILREQLQTSSVVNAYNTIVLANHIDKCIQTKNYTEPELWYPNIFSSWPRGDKLVVKRIKTSSLMANLNSSDIMLTLYQLYPYINGKTIWDYFEATLTEFTSDIDHCLHLLMSYPNINDKFIKAINNQVHKIVDDDQDILSRVGVDNAVKVKLQGINMVHELGYIKPPAYKSNYFVPQYNDNKSLLQQMVVYNAGEYVPTYVGATQKFIPVDGYNQSILIQKFANMTNLTAEYSWTDWVIQKLAECDSSFECIPYKFIEALRTQSAIAYRCQPINFDTASSGSIQPLPETPRGKYINPITANIIARSTSDKNISKTDDNGKISSQWIANIIGIIPYMINKLKAYYNNVGANVEYEGVNTKTELNILLSILSTFYNDIVSYCPRVGFMENLALFDNNKQYHAIAEIIPYLQKYNFENSTSSLFSKYIWANRYFFGTNTDILFPESKNYDRFEKLKEFGGIVFNNNMFANEFDTVMTILGKVLIMSNIAMSGNVNNLYNNIDSYIFKVMVNAMYYSAELVPSVHAKFMDNVFRAVINDNTTIRIYAEEQQKQIQEVPTIEPTNPNDELKQILTNIKQNNKRYVVYPPNDTLSVNNAIDKFKNGTLTLFDIENDPNIYKLYCMLRFQNNDKINILLPDEASSGFISKLFELPNIFWYYLTHVILEQYNPGDVIISRIHDYFTVPDRFKNKIMVDDYKNVTPQTVYAISVAMVVHWLKNVCYIADDFDNNIQLFKDIKQNIYTYSNNADGFDKYLNNIVPPRLKNNDEKKESIFKAICYENIKGITSIKYYIHLISSLIIFSHNTRETLDTYINEFSIDDKTSFALIGIYNFLYNKNIFDIFFTDYHKKSSYDHIDRVVFDTNIDQNQFKDIGYYRVTRTANDRRLITINCNYNDIVLLTDKFDISRYLGYTISPKFYNNPDGENKPTSIGLSYTDKDNNTSMANFDDDNSDMFKDGNVDIAAVYDLADEIEQLIYPNFNELVDITNILTHDQRNIVNPVYIINDKPTNRGFIGGGNQNKLYNLLLSGIIDVNRLYNLPFQINKETSLINAIKNACYLLNTIPEYKVCGVVESNDSYTPETSSYTNGDHRVNIISYLKNCRHLGTNSPINNFVYNNIYIYPPYNNSNNILSYSLPITQEETRYITGYDLFQTREFTNLLTSIDVLSDEITFTENGNTPQGITKIKFDDIQQDNIEKIIKIITQLIVIYGCIGRKTDNTNNSITAYRAFEYDASKITNVYNLSTDNNALCSIDINNPLYYLLTYTNYDHGLTITAPQNFDKILMYFISKIYNEKDFNKKQTIKLALYSVLVSQSLTLETLNNILNNANADDISEILENILNIIFVKSLKSDIKSVFKSSYYDYYYNYSSHDSEFSHIKTPPIENDKSYDVFKNYQIDRKTLLIGNVSQPKIDINDYTYADIDSMTAVYNFVNPTTSLLNASATILNNMGATDKYAIIGQPYKYIIYNKQKTNNIVEHLYGSSTSLIFGKHTINTNDKYEFKNKPKINITEYIDNDQRRPTFEKMFNSIARQDFPIIYNYNKGTFIINDINNTLVALIAHINTYPSVYAFKILLNIIKDTFIDNNNPVPDIVPILLNNILHVRFNMQLPNTIDNMVPDAELNIIDTTDVHYNGVLPLLNTMTNPNTFNNSKQLLYYLDKQTKISRNNNIIRLFDTCKGILDNIKNILITTLNDTVNTGFAHGMFTGGVVNVDGVRNMNDLVKSFVNNTDFIGSYYSPSETYKAIYKLEPLPDNTTLTTQVYNQLFKYMPIETFKTEFMFALIINYFHKYTVSFNSIYNSVIFPSIIYGSSVFNTVATKYKDTFNKVNINHHNDFTEFIHKYITSDNTTNFEEYYKYNDNIPHKVNRDTKSKTYGDLINIIDNNMYDVSKMISINDKLLNIFNKYNFIGEHGNNAFMSSSLLGMLKRIDSVETFTFVILLITKYMSYYNVDTDEDISYTGQIGPNPLGYNIAI